MAKKSEAQKAKARKRGRAWSTNHPRIGRASIFRGKENGVRVQGILTKAGGRAFDQTRRSLAKIYKDVKGHAPKVVSDADVIEYLAIGEEETVKYLEKH